MTDIKEIVCQPFLKLSKKEIDKVKYIYEMASEMGWGRPKEIKALIEEAEQRGIIKEKSENKLKLNYNQKYYDLIPSENRDKNLRKLEEEKLEKPIKNPNTKSEKAINKLVEEHRIDQQIAASKVNQITKEKNIKNVEDNINSILEEIRNN